MTVAVTGSAAAGAPPPPPRPWSRSTGGTGGRELQAIGPYKLLRTLGQGEFGQVRLARLPASRRRRHPPAAVPPAPRPPGAESRDPLDEQQDAEEDEESELLAIKLIHKQHSALASDAPGGAPHTRVPSSNGGMSKREKLQREISILQSLRHPYIIELRQVLESDHYIGLVMQYAAGGELFDYILDQTRLPEPKARVFFAQLMSAISYVHARGIVHRDLKLENILLNAPKTCIYLSDFGFSNRCGVGYQGSGKEEEWMMTSCGSPCYAAPELVTNETGYNGKYADIWSCGVILFAMLAGYLPWDDDDSNPNGRDIHVLYTYILHTPLYYPPDCIFDDARSLISSMLCIEPQERADLTSIQSHPWLRSVGLAQPGLGQSRHGGMACPAPEAPEAPAAAAASAVLLLPPAITTALHELVPDLVSLSSCPSNEALSPPSHPGLLWEAVLSATPPPAIPLPPAPAPLSSEPPVSVPPKHASSSRPSPPLSSPPPSPLSPGEDSGMETGAEHGPIFPSLLDSLLPSHDSAASLLTQSVVAHSSLTSSCADLLAAPEPMAAPVITLLTPEPCEPSAGNAPGTRPEVAIQGVPYGESTTVRTSQPSAAARAAQSAAPDVIDQRPGPSETTLPDAPHEAIPEKEQDVFQFGWFRRPHSEKLNTHSLEVTAMQGVRPMVHTLSARAPLPVYHGATVDPRAICRRPVPEAFVRLVEAVTAYPLLITKMDVPTFRLRIGHKFPATHNAAQIAHSGARFCLTLPSLHPVHGYVPSRGRGGRSNTPATGGGLQQLQRKRPIQFQVADPLLLFVIQLKSHARTGSVFVDFEWKRGNQHTFRQVYEVLMDGLASAGGL